MENWLIPVAQPDTPVHVFFLFMFAYLPLLCSFQSKEMRAFWGNNSKKIPGLTRAFFKHMFCFCSCDLGDCGEHMGTMHRCPFHAVSMVNLPLSSLLVNVKLLNNKTNKKDTCVTWPSNCLPQWRFLARLLFPREWEPRDYAAVLSFWYLNYFINFKEFERARELSDPACSSKNGSSAMEGNLD